MKPCFLRKTEIKLADDKVYTFRALPLTEDLIDLVKQYETFADDPAAGFKALIQAISVSLSYDQDAETIQYLLESGCIPMPDPADDLTSKIMGAMISMG